jgi:hypothetical protein
MLIPAAISQNENLDRGAMLSLSMLLLCSGGSVYTRQKCGSSRLPGAFHFLDNARRRRVANLNSPGKMSNAEIRMTNQSMTNNRSDMGLVIRASSLIRHSCLDICHLFASATVSLYLSLTTGFPKSEMRPYAFCPHFAAGVCTPSSGIRCSLIRLHCPASNWPS